MLGWTKERERRESSVHGLAADRRRREENIGIGEQEARIGEQEGQLGTREIGGTKELERGQTHLKGQRENKVCRREES